MAEGALDARGGLGGGGRLALELVELSLDGVALLVDGGDPVVERLAPGTQRGVLARDLVEARAELRGELLKLQGAITNADMARMNNEVETQGQEPKAVADAFLAEKGLM